MLEVFRSTEERFEGVSWGSQGFVRIRRVGVRGGEHWGKAWEVFRAPEEGGPIILPLTEILLSLIHI